MVTVSPVDASVSVGYETIVTYISITTLARAFAPWPFFISELIVSAVVDVD
jgi:hypothetical protein